MIPIVIAGKDRTLMTIEVVKNFIDHVKDKNLKFIVVSDRSVDGHVEYIDSKLSELDINHVVLQTTNDRYGLGAAINIGLEYALTLNKNVIVMENDWILHRTLDLNMFDDALTNSDIGIISFKQVCDASNVDLAKYNHGGVDYLVKLPRNNGRYSFTVELGLQFISERAISSLGWFKENCIPPDVELQYFNTYNSMPIEELRQKRILSVVCKDLFHTQLNGNQCVAYHIGVISSNNCLWSCPREYLYLSNPQADIDAINKFRN